MYACMNACMNVGLFVCLSVCMYVRMYACKYGNICTLSWHATWLDACNPYSHARVYSAYIHIYMCVSTHTRSCVWGLQLGDCGLQDWSGDLAFGGQRVLSTMQPSVAPVVYALWHVPAQWNLPHCDVAGCGQNTVRNRHWHSEPKHLWMRRLHPSITYNRP